MTGPEHYQEAEGLLTAVADWNAKMSTGRREYATRTSGPDMTAELTLAAAQAHATLALAAATALAHQGEGAQLMGDDRREWIRVASEVHATERRRRAADAAEMAEFRMSEGSTPDA